MRFTGGFKVFVANNLLLDGIHPDSVLSATGDFLIPENLSSPVKIRIVNPAPMRKRDKRNETSFLLRFRLEENGLGIRNRLFFIEKEGVFFIDL